MDVERRARRERDLALDPLEGRGARVRGARAAERGVERGRPPRDAPGRARSSATPSADREHDHEPDDGATSAARPGSDEQERRPPRRWRATRAASVHGRPHAGAPRELGLRALASAAASSSCSSTSVSIASSFISGRTSCPENFAHANSAVSRPAARCETLDARRGRARGTRRVPRRAPRQPAAASDALHAARTPPITARAGRSRRAGRRASSSSTSASASRGVVVGGPERRRLPRTASHQAPSAIAASADDGGDRPDANSGS